MRTPIAIVALLLSAVTLVADSSFVEFKVPCQRPLEQVSKGAALYCASSGFLITFAAPDIGVVYAERRERDAEGEIVTTLHISSNLDTIYIRCRSMRENSTTKLSPFARQCAEYMADWAGTTLIAPSDSPERP